MLVDFTNGDYEAYLPSGDKIGPIGSDGNIRSEGDAVFRIDGDEVYSTEIPANFLGEIEGRQAISVSGQVLFEIRDI